MVAPSTGTRFTTSARDPLSTTSARAIVTLDPTKPQQWQKFWTKAQATLDEKGLLDVVTHGPPSPTLIAEFIAHIEATRGLGDDPDERRLELENEFLDGWASQNRKAYNVLMPMIELTDSRLHMHVRNRLDKSRSAYDLLTFLKKNMSAKAPRRQKQVQIEMLNANMLALNTSVPLPFGEAPTADLFMEFIDALVSTWLDDASSDSSNPRTLIDLTLMITRRVPALRQWAIDTKTGIDHGTVSFVDIEAFIDELHAKADRE